MNKKLSIVFVALLLIVPIVSLAADFKVGEELFISDVVRDNLYVVASRTNVSANVVGDAVVAGGDVSISGAVSQDVLVAGGNITVLGVVSGDARIAGGQIFIHEDVGGDLTLAGGDVVVMPGVTVGGDVSVAAGRLVFNGDTGGDFSVRSGEVVLNGVVRGSTDIKAGNVALGENAVVMGDFVYQAQNKAKIAEGAQILGETNFTKKAESKIPGFLAPLILAISFIGKIILLLVVGLLAVILFKKFSQNVVEHSIANFGSDLLKGLGVLIITPILLVILLATIVGIPIAFIGGLVWVLVLALSKVYAGIVTGGLLAKWIKKRTIVNWKWAALGILSIQLVAIIPFLGWLVALVVFLATLGSVSYFAHQKFWVER